MNIQNQADGFSSLPAIRVLMMPRDTNPAGTIFGGVILSYIDQAGAEAALLHGAKNIVTVAMKEVVFLEPVFVGDQVSFYVKMIQKGRTSITVKVKVEAARRFNRREIVRVTEAEITYVNVNSDREPTPLNPNDR
jgi:acyl-CoA thioesterase YciA